MNHGGDLIQESSMTQCWQDMPTGIGNASVVCYTCESNRTLFAGQSMQVCIWHVQKRYYVRHMQWTMY